MNQLPRHSISSPMGLKLSYPNPNKFAKSYTTDNSNLPPPPQSQPPLLIDTASSNTLRGNDPLHSGKPPATPWTSSFMDTTKPKRIWVKTPNGNPTTITAYSEDIVDDLKTLVIQKYPNTIGRYDDAANLILKIDVSNSRGTNTSPNTNLKSAVDNNNNNNINYIILEPDQNVWHLLDTYFPHGMGMNDALVIDVLPLEQESPTDTQFHRQEQRRTSSFDNSKLVHDPVKQPHPIQSGQSMHRPNPISPHASFQHGTPHSIPSQKYPPTRIQTAAGANSHYVERSVSPATNASKNISPVPIYRSLSQSIISPNQKDQNPQAVLLLPKNFSLSNNQTSTPSRTKNSPEETLTTSEQQQAPTPSSSSSTTTTTATPSASTKKLSEEDKSDNSHNNNNSSHDSQSIAPSTSTTLKDVEPFDAPKPEQDNASFGLPTSSPSTRADAVKKNSEPLSSSSITKSTKSERSDPTLDKVLPSISVLVVEDNAINQAILGAFLRKRKIHYQIAKNGQDAIDKWKKGGFHLVLMDIQLPVKSGIEATKEIRHLEKLNKIGVFDEKDMNKVSSIALTEADTLDSNVFRSPVIIVALTASSNSSVDRKNALTAGCNDYLTKPVNLVWLQNKITEWGCMQALIDFEGWKSKNNWNVV
ncbi:uncharacterized protein LODBEIA_P12660 [Lodderomyces beijingensis]|uniref:Response regulatory domain-containing protein n=1 Tax=Lodderomyces beijingensis TaxID=1775926 RepID=A0ABP0ZHX2_9ASCO